MLRFDEPALRRVVFCVAYGSLCPDFSAVTQSRAYVHPADIGACAVALVADRGQTDADILSRSQRHVSAGACVPLAFAEAILGFVVDRDELGVQIEITAQYGFAEGYGARE